MLPNASKIVSLLTLFNAIDALSPTCNNHHTTTSPTLFFNHDLGANTLNQNRHMRDNADFSAQGLQSIQAGDGYIQRFRVQTAEAFVDKQRFNLSFVG